jgi:PAS domain S-box-containing protein
MELTDIEHFGKNKLATMVVGLQSELAEEKQKRKVLHDKLQRKEFQLKERTKELGGIYSVTQLINNPDNTTEFVLNQSLKILSDSYLYPRITCGRLSYGQKCFQTDNFKETKWKQSIELSVGHNKNKLTIEIFYLEECAERDEGPFLKEERELLQTVGSELAVYLRRKHFEEELHKKNQNFELIFNSVKDAVFIHDLKGKMIEVNREAWKRLGYSREELLNMTPMDIDDPIFAKKVPSILDQLYQDGFYRGETIHLTKQGKKIPSEININRIRFEGKPAILTVSRDITERKNYEKELLDAKNIAEESSELKSAFLANLSHEIRTPLNGIMGFTDMLTSDNQGKSKKEEFAKYIKKSSERLLKIVEDILLVSFIESGQMEVKNEHFSLNNMIDILAIEQKTIREELKKTIDLTIYKSLEDGDDIVSGDSEKIQNVFLKLLDNALKFTKEGEVKFGYKLLADENEIEFYVQDTGIGVPEDSLESIFESFRQYDQGVTRRYEGLGLGLSIAKGIVHQLGGEIHFESEVNKGSNVSFTVPVKFPEEPSLKEKEIIPEKEFTGKTILVVDDEVSHFELVKEFLYHTGAALIHAENGAEAIETLKELQQVNLVIMDIRMPEMNGIEALKKIKKIIPEIPVIALTVFASEQDEKNIIEAGFNGYLSKPMKRDQLVGYVQRWV